MKKIITIALALAMVLSLAACGSSGSGTATTAAPGGEATTAAPAGGETTAAPAGETQAQGGSSAVSADGKIVIHMANDGDVGSWAPYGTEGVRQNFVRPVYETLGRMTATPNEDGTPGLEMKYVLAKEVTQVEDGVYDITLYDYIHDSEGNNLTAQDVVFSFGKYEEAGVNLKYISSLDKIEAVDDYTVRMTLKDERAGALDTMFENVRIITQAAWEASSDDMASKPVGTAPYRLEEYAEGSYARLVKVDDYWQTDESLIAFTSMSNADEIYIDVTPDASAQTIALQSGGLDSSGYIKAQDLVNFVDNDLNALPGYAVSKSMTSKTYMLIFNCSDNSPCKDINLRKAIATALDKQALSASAWGIIGIPIESVVSPYCKDYPQDFKSAYQYDVDQAKKYLDESDYNGETIRILIYNDYKSDAATLIQAYCAAIGVNVELLQYDKAMYNSYSQDNTGTQYDIELAAPFCTGYAWDPMSIFDKNNYENGMPHICINDDKLQEAYETMAVAKTNSIETTEAFCKYIDDQCYGVGLGTYWKLGVCNDKFKTVVLSQTGNLVPGACEYNN